MNIYYTYRLTHKTTGQFYIGSHKMGRRRYYSSSKEVKRLGFENFNIQIIKHDYWNYPICYWHEQQMIKENIVNPLCLNKRYVDPITGKGMFSISSRLGKKHTEESKEKMRLASTGKKHTIEARRKISAAGIGRVFTPEAREKIRCSNLARWERYRAAKG